MYSLFWTPFIVREHYPAVALLERGSLNVDRYLGWNEDIFRGPRGGAYINNNPGASIAGAVPLLAAAPLLKFMDGRKTANADLAHMDSIARARAAQEGRAEFFLWVSFLTVAGLMAPLSAVCAVLLGKRALQLGVPLRHAVAVGLLLAFGTPIFFRTLYLNHNLLVCDAGLVAFLLLWRPGGEPITAARTFTAGLLAGFSVLCDFSGLVVLGMLGLYVLLRGGEESGPGRLRALIWYALGAVPGLVGLLAYQTVAFGNFLRPPQHYMVPTAPTSIGYRGFSWPSISLMWANFFDPRFGLFAYCPLLLLGLFSPLARRVPHRVPDRERNFILLFFAAFVLFCAANQYSWLQPSTGFRYLVPVVPGMLLLSLQTLQLFPLWAQKLTAAFSIFLNCTIAATYHGNVLHALANVFGDGWRLVWVETLWDLRIIAHPARMSFACYLLTFVVIALIWRTRRKQPRLSR